MNNDSTQIEEALFNDLLDDLSLGLIFQVHRACKLGYFNENYLSDDKRLKPHEDTNNVPHNEPQLQAPLKQKYECTCPNCDRNLNATRFAPHLEKCMGLGRNSSRLASKKITSFSSDDSIDQLLDHNEAIQHSLALTQTLASTRPKRKKTQSISNNVNSTH